MSATCSSNRWMTSYIVTFLPHNGNPFTLYHSSQIQSVCLYHSGFNAGNKSSSKYCKDTRTQNQLQNQLESLQEPTVGWNSTKEAATSAMVREDGVSGGLRQWLGLRTSGYKCDPGIWKLWSGCCCCYTLMQPPLNIYKAGDITESRLYKYITIPWTCLPGEIAGAAVQWPLFHFCLLNLTQIHLTACKGFWEI